MLPDSNNKTLFFIRICVSILIIIKVIIDIYHHSKLHKIDKNKDIKVIKEAEKQILISCLKCNSEKGNISQEHQEILSQSINIKGNIQKINGVKHHHYIVPDSEFDNEGIITNACNQLFKFFGGWKPTLMHSFIKKLNPNYNG